MSPSDGTRSRDAIRADGATLCALIQENNRYLGGCFGWNGYMPGYYNNRTRYVKTCPIYVSIKASGLPTWCSWTGGCYMYLLNTLS